MPPTAAFVHTLRQRVGRDRRRWQRLALLEAFALLVAAPLGYLWVVFWLDNALHLPAWARLLAVVLFVAGVVYLAVRLVRSWLRLQLSEDQVALAIERSTPGGVQNRLINALQLARGQGAGTDVNDVVVTENFRALEKLSLGSAAPWRPAAYRMSIAGLVLLIGGAFWVLKPDGFTNAATRLFLPFADVTPIYRTRLLIEPGHARVMPGQPLALSIAIEGEMPDHLTLLRQAEGGQRTTIRIPVDAQQRSVTYTIDRIDLPTRYAVRGNDFTSEYYRIDVPLPSQLRVLKARLHDPPYTGRPDRELQSTDGSLEALYGTRAELTFQLDQPADKAVMLVETLSNNGSRTQELTLTRQTATTFTGSLMIQDVTGYRLRTSRGDDPPHESRIYTLRVLADESPTVELTGLERRSEVAVDAQLPLGVTVRDDFGLRDAGLFYQPVALGGGIGNSGGEDSGGDDSGGWQLAEQFQFPTRATEFTDRVMLAVSAMSAAEGDTIRLALRARDYDPLKGDHWTTGEVYLLRVGGEGAALQVLYERILATEAAIRQAIDDQESLSEQAIEWLAKLNPGSAVRWDDQKNIDELTKAMADQSLRQSQLRERTGAAARDMVELAGQLRLSLAMLADSEMVRASRILDTVARREHPQQMLAALADARLTQQRTVRSLNEIHQQYVKFRQDWELANMTPFIHMLAERQQRMSDETERYAALAGQQENLVRSMSRRQAKLTQLTGLAQTAFAGLHRLPLPVPPQVQASFGHAAEALAAEPLKAAFQQSLDQVNGANWSLAAQSQAQAAAALDEVYQMLKQAQEDAARALLEELARRRESDLLAQQEIGELDPGDKQSYLDIDLESLTLTELIRYQKASDEQREKQEREGEVNEDFVFNPAWLNNLQRPDTGVTQDPDTLSLSDTASGYGEWPAGSMPEERNTVVPYIQEDFVDLVGDLLDVTDMLTDMYTTLTVTVATNTNEPGDVTPGAHEFSSVNAAAATGNQPPPPTDVGGASRVGFLGGRSHGAAIGDESVNRRGMDEAMEGQQRSAMQEGTIRETMSDDPQIDQSVGLGGKKVESDTPNTFNVKDIGEWEDDMADHMDDPKDAYAIVERMGAPIDASVAEKLRKLDDTQEQIIERIKAIKKELDKLYLPTDHLDQIAAELAANLDRLKQQPEGDVFRRQQELLSQLRAIVSVFNPAGSDFQPSLPRQQSVRGRIIDDPLTPPPAAYDLAIKRYYEKLAQ